MDLLLVVVGVAGWTTMVAASALWPDRMLAAAILVGIAVPVDLAVKIGDLPRIGPTRLLASAFMCGWALRLMSDAVTRRDYRSGRVKFPLRAMMALYMAVAGFSAALSIDPRTSLYALADQLLMQYLMCFAVWRGLAYQPFWPRLRTSLYVVTWMLCAYAVIEVLSQQNPFLVLYPEEQPAIRAGVMRVRSVFFHPIAFGCYLSLIFPLVLTDTLGEPRPARRAVLGVLCVVIAVCGLLTISRAPIAGILGGGLLVAFEYARHQRSRRFRIVRAGLAVAAVSVGLILFLPPGGEDAMKPSRIAASAAEEGSSDYYRVALVLGVVERLEGWRWFYGYGPGTFREAQVESYYAGHHHVLTAADSHYAKILLEEGVLGLAMFLALVGTVLGRCWQAARHATGKDRLLATACLASVTAFAFENLSASMFDLASLGIPFWVSVAVSLRIGRSCPAPRTQEAARGPGRQPATASLQLAAGSWV